MKTILATILTLISITTSVWAAFAYDYRCGLVVVSFWAALYAVSIEAMEK